MKLYIGNLPLSLEESEFEQLFTEFTSVTSCKLIINRDTNKSKGFGFVEFSSKDEALKAIKDLHGKEVGGRPLVVNEARPQEKREHTSSFKRRY